MAGGGGGFGFLALGNTGYTVQLRRVGCCSRGENQAVGPLGRWRKSGAAEWWAAASLSSRLSAPNRWTNAAPGAPALCAVQRVQTVTWTRPPTGLPHNVVAVASALLPDLADLADGDADLASCSPKHEPPAAPLLGCQYPDLPCPARPPKQASTPRMPQWPSSAPVRQGWRPSGCGRPAGGPNPARRVCGPDSHTGRQRPQARLKGRVVQEGLELLSARKAPASVCGGVGGSA